MSIQATNDILKVSHLGKNGDLIYALPVIKALARIHGRRIHLVTSALCFQVVPIVWDQPYIADVEMLYGEVKITDNCLDPWAVLGPGEGINLSPQPAMYRPDAPQAWTQAYQEIAGVEELTIQDRIALPTLWNHRQWYWEHQLVYADKPTWAPPRMCVVAPESESLKTAPMWIWVQITQALAKHYRVYIIGIHPDDAFSSIRGTVDLRGYTTMASAARLLAEAHLVVSACSLPFHIARHCGTPTICLQDQYLERSMPIDTPYRWFVTSDWEKVLDVAKDLAKNPKTNWWREEELRKLYERPVAPVAA